MPTQRLPVLNWHPRNTAAVDELRSILQSARDITHPSSYIPRSTVRLGRSWADQLTPGQLVALSVSDDLRQPRPVGRAMVAALVIVSLDYVQDVNLRQHIGAKTQAAVLADLRVGAPDTADNALVSVVELKFLNERGLAALTDE